MGGYGQSMRDRWIRLYKKGEKSDAPNYESTIHFLKYIQLQATQMFLESCAEVAEVSAPKKMSFKEKIVRYLIPSPRPSKKRLIQLQATYKVSKNLLDDIIKALEEDQPAIPKPTKERRRLAHQETASQRVMRRLLAGENASVVV